MLNKRLNWSVNVDLLSDREKECIEHLCCGLSGKEIAHAMNISIRTVQEHILATLR